MNMKKKIFPVAIAAVALGTGAFFAYFALRPEGPRVFRSAGMVEGTEVNIAPMISGRIVKRPFREGDTVRKGDLLVELESDQLQASVDQARATVKKSRADIAVQISAIDAARAEVASADANIQSAAADLEKARAQMKEAERESRRARNLDKTQGISRQALDQAITAQEAAVADVRSAEAKEAAAKAGKRAAEAQRITAVNQLAVAKYAEKEAAANLVLCEANLAQTRITSPISGAVVYTALNPGEIADPGVTILTIVNLAHPYVRVDVEETVVTGIRIGAPAVIRTEGDDGLIFAGKVSRIGRYADFATQTDVTRGRQDIKTFNVRIDIEHPDGRLKPGMTVEATIPLRGRP